MASTEITGLSFQLEASNSSKAVRQLDKLSSSLQKLSTSLKGSTSTINKLSTLSNSLSQLNGIKISSSISTQLTKISDSLKTITEDDVGKLERLTSALASTQNTEGIKVSVSNSGAKVEGTDSSTGIAQGTKEEKYTDQFDSEKVKALWTSFDGLEKSGNKASAVIGTIGKKAISTGSAFGKVTSAVGRVSKGFGNLINTFHLNPFKTLSSGISNAVNKLGQFFSSIKRIAMYRAIRFVISQITQGLKEGVNNLYQYSKAVNGTFASSMDKISTSLQYFKNSLGAAAAPILNALAPALDVLVDKIVSVINWVGKLMAALTGSKTYTVAKKVQTSYADAASSAKEIQKSLMGFDEINQLNDSSSSGSGSSTPSYGSMFENVGIDSDISDFASRLKKAFEDEDWHELGTLIGNKVNEVIEDVDWDGIGKKAGKLFSGSMLTMYYALDTIDWHMLGEKLSTSVNSFIDEGLKKDSLGNDGFTALGANLMKGITISLDTLIGFFENLDTHDVGQAFGNMIKGFFNEGIKFINKYDWSKLGNEAYQGVKDAIEGMDVKGCAQSFAQFLGKVVGAALGFIGGFVAGAFADIGSYFEEKTNAMGGDAVAGFLKGIIDGLANIGEWILENILAPFLNGFMTAFGIASPSKVMKEQGGYIVSGLLEGIKDLPSKISNTFYQAVENAKKWFKGLPSYFSGIWGQIKNTFSALGTKIGSAISGAVKTGINGIISSIQNVINSAIKLINGAIKIINKIPGVNISKIGTLSFPKLARGGYATDETTATIGEAGKEAVLPLENHTEWADIVASKLTESMTGSNGNLAQAIGNEVYNAILSGNADKPINITVYPTLNGNAIGEASVKYHNGIVAQTGVSPLTI